MVTTATRIIFQQAEVWLWVWISGWRSSSLYHKAYLHFFFAFFILSMIYILGQVGGGEAYPNLWLTTGSVQQWSRQRSGAKGSMTSPQVVFRKDVMDIPPGDQVDLAGDTMLDAGLWRALVAGDWVRLQRKDNMNVGLSKHFNKFTYYYPLNSSAMKIIWRLGQNFSNWYTWACATESGLQFMKNCWYFLWNEMPT